MSISYTEWGQMPAMLRADILLLAAGLAEYERREIERVRRHGPDR